MTPLAVTLRTLREAADLIDPPDEDENGEVV